MKDAIAAITLLGKRLEKIQALNGIRTYDLSVTGAMLNQLSRYQSHMRAVVSEFFQVIFPVVLWLHSHSLWVHARHINNSDFVLLTGQPLDFASNNASEPQRPIYLLTSGTILASVSWAVDNDGKAMAPPLLTGNPASNIR